METCATLVQDSSVLTMMRGEAGKRNYLGFVSHIKDFELAACCNGNH